VFAIMSVVVSFFGYKFLHWYYHTLMPVFFNCILLTLLHNRYERLAWIPVMIATIIAIGESWKNLGSFPSPVPVSSASVLGFISTLAGFMITWSTFVADYGIYLKPRGSK